MWGSEHERTSKRSTLTLNPVPTSSKQWQCKGCSCILASLLLAREAQWKAKTMWKLYWDESEWFYAGKHPHFPAAHSSDISLESLWVALFFMMTHRMNNSKLTHEVLVSWWHFWKKCELAISPTFPPPTLPFASSSSPNSTLFLQQIYSQRHTKQGR